MANTILHAKFKIDTFIFEPIPRTMKFTTVIEAKTGILDPLV